MSLDIYLIEHEPHAEGGSGIFVRENGRTREITRQEWEERFPGAEPLTVEMDSEGCVFSANITHNLGRMAQEAGLYSWIWRPDENGADEAGQIIGKLTEGLDLLKSDRKKFEAFNPENGWGDYDRLVEFVEEYLEACVKYPYAKIEVSR